MKDTYTQIIDAMECKDIKDDKGNTTKTIPVYKDNLHEEIKNKLFHEIQIGLINDDNVSFELSFKIMYDALALFQDVDYNDLEAFEPLECIDIASIYYGEQLSYLDVNNMYAISDIMKEYACESIADACSIWYESTVKDTALTIKNYIMSHD